MEKEYSLSPVLTYDANSSVNIEGDALVGTAAASFSISVLFILLSLSFSVATWLTKA